MGPEISQFLSGMKKTIEQVVMPNLTDRFAQEQAGIIAATLGFLDTVQDKVFHYELLENYEYKRILQDILASFGQEEDTPQAVKNTLENIQEHFAKDKPEDAIYLRPYTYIRASNEVMKELLCELIQQQPAMSNTRRGAFEALLKPFLKSIETRERSWVKALGFDPEAKQQPDIATLLYSEGYLNIKDNA